MDNPWDNYDKTFAEGTVHNGTISDSNDKGSTIIFNDDVIAFVPSRHLLKEDGNKLKKGESADFKVIEYNKDFKRVVMSHTVIFK
jgi:small subunit ribosomal protein S1